MIFFRQLQVYFLVGCALPSDISEEQSNIEEPGNCTLEEQECTLPGESNDTASNDIELIGTSCTVEQKAAEFCTLEYMPVCGYDSDGIQLGTYGNICGACSDEPVVSYEQGACRIQCTPEQIAEQGAIVPCTREFMPVCGFTADNEQLGTFGNKCEACASVGVIEYEEGECWM